MSRLTTLSDVCEFVLDGTHGSPERTETGIPVLSAMNVKDGRLSYETNRYTSESEFQAFDRRIGLAKGDLLLTIVGTIGRAAIVEEVFPAVFQRSVAIIRPTQSKIDSRFLFHATQSAAFSEQLDRATNKSAQAGVYLGKLKSTLLPLPPLDEQKRIAAILDQADELRRKRQRAIDRLNQLGQAIFHEMFGDPATNPKGWPIGTIRDLIAEAKYGTAKKANTEGKGTPILRMGNLSYDGQIDLGDIKYVELANGEFAKYTTKFGDILFNRTNSKELVGKTAVVMQDEPLAIAGYLVRARVNRMGNPFYVSAYLNSAHGKTTLRNMCKNIVGMANINAQEFQDIRIAKPPKDQQDQFQEAVLEIERRKVPLRDALSESERLFSSLQSRAFQGEL